MFEIEMPGAVGSVLSLISALHFDHPVEPQSCIEVPLAIEGDENFQLMLGAVPVRPIQNSTISTFRARKQKAPADWRGPEAGSGGGTCLCVRSQIVRSS